MYPAFAKATHIFSEKNTSEFDIVLTRTVNILTNNELVKLKMLWTTGPCCFFPSQKSIYTYLFLHENMWVFISSACPRKGIVLNIEYPQCTFSTCMSTVSAYTIIGYCRIYQSTANTLIRLVCLFVLRFYSPVNPMGSCWARSVYLTMFTGQA